MRSAALLLVLLASGFAGPLDTSAGSSGLRIAYQSEVLGEVDPCG
jgi:hypothetical protein